MLWVILGIPAVLFAVFWYSMRQKRVTREQSPSRSQRTDESEEKTGA